MSTSTSEAERGSRCGHWITFSENASRGCESSMFAKTSVPPGASSTRAARSSPAAPSVTRRSEMPSASGGTRTARGCRSPRTAHVEMREPLEIEDVHRTSSTQPSRSYSAASSRANSSASAVEVGQSYLHVAPRPAARAQLRRPGSKRRRRDSASDVCACRRGDRYAGEPLP